MTIPEDDGKMDVTDEFMYLGDVIEELGVRGLMHKDGVFEALVPLFRTEIDALHKQTCDDMGIHLEE